MAIFDRIIGQGNNPNPWIDKAASLFDQGKYAEAVKNLEKALEIEPENGNLCYKMGTALMHIARYDDAERYF
ncbi:MAG: tetratricopeptide repeat protein, partial [Methanomicrobium sp.]|nr:tetratricopeptide repeat protein [Methanomicrobium sp.]